MLQVPPGRCPRRRPRRAAGPARAGGGRPPRRRHGQSGRRAATQVVHDVAGTVRVLDAAVAARAARSSACGGPGPGRRRAGHPRRAVHEYLAPTRSATASPTPRWSCPRCTALGRPRPASRVVAVFVQRALAGEPCVVHGDGASRGTCSTWTTRSTPSSRALDRADGATVEVGTGIATTIGDLQAAVVRVAGVDRGTGGSAGPTSRARSSSIPVGLRAARLEAVDHARGRPRRRGRRASGVNSRRSTP